MEDFQVGAEVVKVSGIDSGVSFEGAFWLDLLNMAIKKKRII